MHYSPCKQTPIIGHCKNQRFAVAIHPDTAESIPPKKRPLTNSTVLLPQTAPANHVAEEPSSITSLMAHIALCKRKDRGSLEGKHVQYNRNCIPNSTCTAFALISNSRH
ncbi:hypothetical protein EAE99_009353 [Botrytis elliptica]|nr:hypothetical protein EAE99_009353 [Botrytis elliptica]